MKVHHNDILTYDYDKALAGTACADGSLPKTILDCQSWHLLCTCAHSGFEPTFRFPGVFEDGDQVHLIGNLPFGVATPLLFGYLKMVFESGAELRMLHFFSHSIFSFFFLDNYPIVGSLTDEMSGV